MWHATASLRELSQSAVKVRQPRASGIDESTINVALIHYQHCRTYAASGPTLRTMILGLYLVAWFVRQLARGRGVRFLQERGMNWFYDAIDWVGGYPYESASSTEVVEFVERLGFRCIGMKNVRPSFGLLGSVLRGVCFQKGSS